MRRIEVTSAVQDLSHGTTEARDRPVAAPRLMAQRRLAESRTLSTSGQPLDESSRRVQRGFVQESERQRFSPNETFEMREMSAGAPRRALELPPSRFVASERAVHERLAVDKSHQRPRVPLVPDRSGRPVRERGVSLGRGRNHRHDLRRANDRYQADTGARSVTTSPPTRRVRCQPRDPRLAPGARAPDMRRRTTRAGEYLPQRLAQIPLVVKRAGRVNLVAGRCAATIPTLSRRDA
jgi:hypothetical protein